MLYDLNREGENIVVRAGSNEYYIGDLLDTDRVDHYIARISNIQEEDLSDEDLLNVWREILTEYLSEFNDDVDLTRASERQITYIIYYLRGRL